MAEERMAAVDVVREAREAVRHFVYESMDEEVTVFQGAGHYERSELRTKQRTGLRHRQ